MQPPQNSDEQQLSASQPAPVYAPSPAYMPPPQAPRGIVSMEVISEAWTYLSPNIGPWILAMLAYIGIPYAIGAINNVLQLLVQNGGSPLWLILTVIVQLTSWIATQLLLGGITRLAINTVQTRTTNINELWTATNVGVSLVLSALLQSLIYLAACLPGFVVLGVGVVVPLVKSGIFSRMVLTPGKAPPIPPSLIGQMLGGIAGGFLLIFLASTLVGALLYMTTFLIVHRKVGPLEAVSGSFAALKKHFWGSLLLLFVLGLINLGGFAACCVGIFLTFPLTMISLALVYRDLFGLDASAPQTTIYAPPPIAHPDF